MVPIHMLSIGWFTLYFIFWPAALIHWPIFLVGFLLKDKLKRRFTRGLFFAVLILTMLGCEIAWYCIHGYDRYATFIVDAVAIALLSGYGTAALWPHFKNWLKANI